MPRKYLPHDTPTWVPDGSLFFITIHCATRRLPQLTVGAVAEKLLDAVRYYHRDQRWFARLFLLMPDHAHALLAFPRDEQMRAVVGNWKRFTARDAGLKWQRDFFDHRVRAGENWQLKADYIRLNPVRAGLIGQGEPWPHTLESVD